MTNKTYIDIPDAELEVDAPVTQQLLTKLRDNQMSIAQGDASAPAQQVKSFNHLPAPIAGNETTAVMLWNPLGKHFTSSPKGTLVFQQMRMPVSGTVRLHMQVYFSYWQGGSVLLKRTNDSGTETLMTFEPTGTSNDTVPRVSQTITTQNITADDILSFNVDGVPDATDMANFWAYLFVGVKTQDGCVKLYKDIDELEATSAVIATKDYDDFSAGIDYGTLKYPSFNYRSYAEHSNYGATANLLYNHYVQKMILIDGV